MHLFHIICGQQRYKYTKVLCVLNTTKNPLLSWSYGADRNKYFLYVPVFSLIIILKKQKILLRFIECRKGFHYARGTCIVYKKNSITSIIHTNICIFDDGSLFGTLDYVWIIFQDNEIETKLCDYEMRMLFYVVFI